MNRASFIARRYRRERLFCAAGVGATVVALLFLVGLFAGIAALGWRGLLAAEMRLAVHLDEERLGPADKRNPLKYQALLRDQLRAEYPDLAASRAGRKELNALLSFGASVELHELAQDRPELLGTTVELWLPASSKAEAYLKGAPHAAREADPRILSDAQLDVLDTLVEAGRARTTFNSRFFTSADSRDPELAGIAGAAAGSFFALLVTFIISFPLAIGAAIFLELFASRNRFFTLIEININNLAAVPSVIFGLLGLGVFINIFGVPRSTPLVGGMCLSLMTLPTMVIAARSALGAVPPNLLEAAVALGATRMQGTLHHVLPMAMPGILTGAIIGMAGALGETAPLILIGMIVFLTEIPTSALDAATSLPAQIFLWADSPERGFVERVAMAIMTLLVFLVLMNAAAVALRSRLEIRQ